MSIPIPDLISPAIDTMREHHRRARQAEANAVQRAAAYLDAAQAGVAALGQTAQQLHGAAATFEPSAPDSEARAREIRQQTYEYLYVNRITFELDGITAGLKEIRHQLATGGSPLNLPRTRRRREDAVAELEATVTSVISLLDKVAGLTRHLRAGTGFGAVTLARIYAILDDPSWRERPVETREQLKNAAQQFRSSQENVAWQPLSRQLSGIKDKLFATFPEP
jgi:hypothetical protein